MGRAAFDTARPAGVSAFRFTVPMSTLREVHPDARIVDHDWPGSCDVYLPHDVSKRSIVMYPLRNRALLNVACVVPDGMIGKATESWAAGGTREELLSCFTDFGPFVNDILA